MAFDLDELKTKVMSLADKAGLDDLAAKAKDISSKEDFEKVLGKVTHALDADGDGTPDFLEKAAELASKAGLDDIAAKATSKASELAGKAGLDDVADAARSLGDKLK